MSADDPFERLNANLNKPVEEAAPALTARDLYARTATALPDFFEAVTKFDDILQRHGGRIGFNFTRADVPNFITYGDLVIAAGSRHLATLPISFQGKALWINHKDFVSFAKREAKKGNWNLNEIPDLVKYLGAYIETLMRPQQKR